MSRLEELEQELKELAKKEFMVQMIDHWTSEDSRYDDYLWSEMKRVKEEIQKELSKDGKTNIQ